MTDLEARVANRKRELMSELIYHKKNSSRASATAAIDVIRARLSELAQIVKDGVVVDWANVGPSARLKLNEWMAR